MRNKKVTIGPKTSAFLTYDLRLGKKAEAFVQQMLNPCFFLCNYSSVVLLETPYST
jgi:hypothetical protein